MRRLPMALRRRIEGKPALQQILGNTLWLSADRLTRMAVGLVVGAWVARHLQPGPFGLLNYAAAFASILGAVAGLGLDSIVVRDLVKAPDRRGEILGTAFALRAAGGAISVLLVAAAVLLLRPAGGAASTLIMVLSFGSIFQALDVVDFWFQSRVASKYVAVCRSVAFFAASALRVVLIVTGAPLVGFAAAVVAEVALAAAGFAVAYRAAGESWRSWGWNTATAAGLLRDGWPLILSALMIMIYMRVDQIMLGQMAGPEEVGIYSAAVLLTEAWYFVPVAVASSTLPAIVEAHAQGEGVFFERLQQLYNAMAFMGYCIAIPMSALAWWIVQLLYGARYERAAPILATLVWSILFTNLGVARSSFLTAMNWTKVHFFTVALGCLVNVGLNLVWIPRWGAMGAVAASCIAYWLAAHGACFLYAPLRRTGAMLTKALICPRVW